MGNPTTHEAGKMVRSPVAVLLVFLFVFGIAFSAHAAEKKTEKKPVKEVKRETREAVMLLPLRPSKDISKEEITQYEAALVKSLKTQYVVYAGETVMQALDKAFRNRSANTPAGKECDDTKCVQDAAIEFQAELIAKADIMKIGGGYSISLTIKDILEDKAVFSERKSCKGCDVFGVAEVLETFMGGVVAPPAVEAPAAQLSKGAGGNDMELAFWNSIKDSTNPAVFEAYLKEYPNGKFASLAKIQMAVKSPAQIAAEKAAAYKVAAEKAAADKIANPPEGMVYVKQGSGGFFIDKTEVTQEAYQRVIGSNPSFFTGCPTCPVEQVSWDEAEAYCKKVGKRLPTEQEWEYAATSGGKGETYAGTSNEGELGDYAWYDKNSDKKTHPVGEKKPNGLGLYDMSGNVWEWTDSWHDDSKKLVVLRGGSWYHYAINLRTASRLNNSPDFRNSDFGFRCAQ